MAPRDFSTDGAFGATQGGSIPGVTMNDPGPGATPTATPQTAAPQTLSGTMGATPGMGGGGPGMMGAESFSGNEMGGTLSGTDAINAANNIGLHFASSPGFAGMFAGGGSIPSVPGSQSESGEPPIQPMPGPLPPTGTPFGTRQTRPAGGVEASWKNDLDQAMQTVDAALSYGRKLHGLPSEDPDQQSKQMASRMPAVPGNQSESGLPPARPMPGPLPPTSTPFGKRGADNSDQQQPQPGQQQPDQAADAENETPGAAPQQTAGAIPDDDNEETA